MSSTPPTNVCLLELALCIVLQSFHDTVAPYTENVICKEHVCGCVGRKKRAFWISRPNWTELCVCVVGWKTKCMCCELVRVKLQRY